MLNKILNNSKNYFQLLSGNTFLESIYLLNSENNFEITEEIRAYIELQTEIVKIFIDFSGKTTSEIDFKHLTNEIIEMIRLESDLSKVSSILFILFNIKFKYKFNQLFNEYFNN